MTDEFLNGVVNPLSVLTTQELEGLLHVSETLEQVSPINFNLKKGTVDFGDSNQGT